MLHESVQPRLEAASNALAAVDGAFKDLMAYLHGGEPSAAAATMGEADALLRMLDTLARDLDAAHADNDRCARVRGAGCLHEEKAEEKGQNNIPML